MLFEWGGVKERGFVVCVRGEFSVSGSGVGWSIPCTGWFVTGRGPAARYLAELVKGSVFSMLSLAQLLFYSRFS